MTQQEIRNTGIELFCQNGHGVQVVQNGAVAVRLGEVAVIVLGANGTAVAEVVVAGDKNTAGGQILRQRLVTVDEFHHSVG